MEDKNIPLNITGTFNEEFEINPETGKIIDEGYEYENTPRMRENIKRAKRIKESLPSVRDEYIRLWRGNRPGEVGKNPSFTTSLAGIALPFLDVYKGELSYVEIPKSDADKYIRDGVAARESEFILPIEIASDAKIVEDLFRPEPVQKVKEVEDKDAGDESGWGKV